MKQTLGFLVLGAAVVACSGRYYEVGAMDGAGAGGGAGKGSSEPGGSTAGTSHVADPGGGATGTAGAGDSAPACVPSGQPPTVTGQLAGPFTVWSRIAMLTWGKPVPPSGQLPMTTTYAWAGAAVKPALENAKSTLGSAFGVETFLRQALDLGPTATFTQQWGIVASTDNSLLNALLRAPLSEPGRVGIFSEPSWLETKPTISSRGTGIEHTLFGFEVPTPPANVQMPEPDPELQDRAGIERLTLPPVCASCHQLMDPVGYPLGHFAADGTYRELDHGLPIDTSGSRRSGMDPEEVIEFDGIADFGQKFETNCAALQGIASTFLRAALVINEAPEDRRSELFDANVARVQQAFVNGDRTYESLVKAYIQSPAGLEP